MDYKNGKIYTIRSHQTDLFYIGSTTQPLAKRLYEHKSNYKRFLNNIGHFVTSFEIVKFEDAYIELLEEYPCENKNQLHRREGELIRANDCVNKVIAGRTLREWAEENADKLKEYRDQNSDKIKEKQKEWRHQNANKIKEYRDQNADKIKEYQKEYRDQNADKIKEYRDQNADKIKEWFRKKYTCECGSIVRTGEKTRHFKTKKHLAFFNPRPTKEQEISN